LRYFIAVCNSGGFSRAASVIGVAQPALTRQIKLLEQEVGLPLITRTGRGAEPTEEGKLLLSKSQEHIAGIESAVRELRQKFLKVEGQVALGMCPTIAPFFRAGLEHWVAANAPGTALSIIEAYSGDLNNLLQGKRLDLALTYKPGRTAVAATTNLFSERLVVVSGYATDQEGRVFEIADLNALKLILPSKMHELRRIIDRVCQRHGVLLKPDMELDSLDAVKALLMKRELRYYTILPARSVALDIEARRLSSMAIGSTEMMRTIVVMERADSRKRSVVNVLHNKIVEMARDIGSFSDCVA